MTNNNHGFMTATQHKQAKELYRKAYNSGYHEGYREGYTDNIKPIIIVMILLNLASIIGVIGLALK